MKRKIVKKGILNYIGNFVIVLSLGIIYLIFAPVVGEEVKYQTVNIYQNATEFLNANTSDVSFNQEPPDRMFSLVIPKIRASSLVIADVDSQNEEVFLKTLKKGVAHAKGTAHPGESGNTYLFAHSTDAFYNIGKYNAIFYLIGKLEKGDEIYIYYNNIKFTYRVFDKRVVNPDDVAYLGRLSDKNTLTLQTCYPPGTTFKRLLVLAEEI